ncbi:MAG: ABC transporter ATP-binding protein [Candidatus Micrarchaeota archaeon]|nr:ABC transporter ATP-binding protein [Candidatus Micrarchaeota archaeon]
MADYSVRVNRISKVYRSESVEVDALSDISFSLKKGEFVAIVGPSGSGKSTLMNILGTIDKPSSGELFIDGVATSKMDGDRLAEFRNQKLGFIFQAYNLVNGLTAEMNVELPLMVNRIPASERRERADSMLSQLGLGEKLNVKPTQLSGGQQQRVAVARALVNNPALVLADEPTGNLDTKSGEDVMRLFKEISRKRRVTVVMVTHNPELTRSCDRVIHIRDGRIFKNQVMR